MSIDERRHTSADASVATLLSQAAQQFGQLARDEVRLAQAEMAEQRRNLGFGGGLLGGAGVMAFVALQALVAALIALLALALPVWVAALVAAAAVGLTAAVMARLGKRQMDSATPPMQESVESLKADVDAIKEGGRR
ncbi:phage holin family protein [Catenulispora subtropica]|uniref:Integral membrane protein n=1 Tax=Catenulispora subtropica TaxID=450798 RepID=A0ABP5DW73_9ACTN